MKNAPSTVSLLLRCTPSRALLGLALPLLAACGGAAESAPPPAPPPQPPAPAETVAAAPAAPPAPAAPKADPNLIPRETFFGNPERTGAQISPDGKWIAFLAPVDGVLNVMVAPADDIKKAQAVSHDKVRPVYRYSWTKTKNVLLFMQDVAGDENWHVFEATVPSGEAKDLTPYKGVSAQLAGTSAKHPGDVLIMMNDRDPKYHDLYSVNLKTGARKLLQQNDKGFAGFVTDDDFAVKLAALPQADGSQTLFAAGPKKAFDAVYMTIPFDDALTTSPVGFDDSGKTLYLIDSRDRETAGLFALDFATKKSRLLAEDPKSDIQGVFADPKTHKPLVAVSDYDRQKHLVLDKSVQADDDYLKTVVPGADYSLDTCSDDFKHCIASFVVSDGPVRFYVYDRAKHKADFLFAHRPKLEGLKLAKMQALVLTARDGLPLVSYLSLPAGSDPDGDGKPDHPLPTVLFVHGGPWGRDEWGYNRDHQWLANRGYAVLSVNFRGSTGLGKKFVNAANGEWAGKMHDDLIDAVTWAEKNGIADPQKVAIYGGSYGGYATLVGMTFTPDTFACGVDLFGPSNLITLEQSIPPYWAPFLEQLTKRVGDFRNDDGQKLLTARSPLTHTDAIKKPLLIGQGANDVRVKQAESDQVVKAMQAKSIPVSYVLFSDEGHGFARPANEKAFDAVAETFLAQCLGGSYEPVGSDFKGSTIKVPSGADQIHGVADALK
jgi:dipeptidyl aminopeptidase/acylaminoacyl peptidase